MKIKLLATAIFFFSLVFFASGCEPAQLFAFTNTPLPTKTFIPTLTPTQTLTPIPTKTPIPTLTPIGSDLPLVKELLREEQFGDLASSNFKLFGKYNLSTDGLVLWSSGVISSDFRVKQGNGYLLVFRSNPKTTFYITFEWGPFADPSYRAFWFANGTDIAVWNGSDLLDCISLNYKYQPDTWHFLLMWINSDSIEGKIWEKDHPEINKRFSVQTGSEFINTSLNFTANMPTAGSIRCNGDKSNTPPNTSSSFIEIREFQELEFSQ